MRTEFHSAQRQTRTSFQSGSEKLKSLLAELHMPKVELAKRISVTPRAVNLWTSGSRKVPGAVLAYLDLLLKVRELTGTK